jgi:hypothetical protein
MGMAAAPEDLLCRAAGGLPIPLLGNTQCQEQMPLERALFCIGCESIFTGTARGPWCGSGATVWPRSEWVRAVWPPTTAAPRASSAVDAALPPCQQQKRRRREP